MNRGWLIEQFLQRAMIRGLGYGVLCGELVGLTFFTWHILFYEPTPSFIQLSYENVLFFASLYACFFGGIVGVGVAVVLTILVCAITIRAFLPLYNPTYYLKTIQRWCTIIGGLVAIIMIWYINHLMWKGIRNDLIRWSIFYFQPTLFATVVIWHNSYAIAHWYVRTVEAHAMLEQGIATPFSPNE